MANGREPRKRYKAEMTGQSGYRHVRLELAYRYFSLSLRDCITMYSHE